MWAFLCEHVIRGPSSYWPHPRHVNWLCQPDSATPSNRHILCDYFLAITLTSQWPRWRLKSPASRLFTQPFIQTKIKEDIKAPRHWPLCGEFTGTGEFPAQRASYAENVSIWWRHHGLWRCQYIHCCHSNNEITVLSNFIKHLYGNFIYVQSHQISMHCRKIYPIHLCQGLRL